MARKDSYPTTLSGMPFPRFSARGWRRARRALVSLAAASLVLVLSGYTLLGGSVFAAALVSLLLLESALLREILLAGQARQYALTQVRPLFGDIPPELEGWAADPILIEHAIRLLINVRPRLVLECGSGSSTVAVARCLKILGGRVISLEHDPEFARRTVEMLRLQGLDGIASVITAPLVAREFEGRARSWYGPEYESSIAAPIDVLIVDGPPKATGPQARYPAIPALRGHLAPDCWILLDDGNRPDERAIAHAWSKDLGADLAYLGGGRGGWLLHRPAARHAAGPASA